ncbi:hypothetical protein OF83DRAFT_1171473 [Amylostereum chailletii]|nr:hypothetical protein OF83DRAFT_1171473 [Amylostereum chailletii]
MSPGIFDINSTSTPSTRPTPSDSSLTASISVGLTVTSTPALQSYGTRFFQEDRKIGNLFPLRSQVIFFIPQVRCVPLPPSRDQAPPNSYAEITPPPLPCQSSEQHTSSYSHPRPASVEAAFPPIRAPENMSISSLPPSPAPVVTSTGQTPTESPADLSSSSLTPSSTQSSPPPLSRPQSDAFHTNAIDPSSAFLAYTHLLLSIFHHTQRISFVTPWSGVPAAYPTSDGQLHLPGARWHGIPSLGPTFHICNSCFQTQIAPSRFASQFSPMPTKDEDVDPAHPPTCRFFTRRSRNL